MGWRKNPMGWYGGVYGVRVGFGDIWVHPMPYGVILGVFMGSGLGWGSFGVDGSIRRTLGMSVWDLGHPLAHLGPCGATPHPPGRPWWYLWGLGWVWGHLGSSHAVWDGPGGVYGVRIVFWDIWVHPMPYGIVLGVFMGSGLGLWSFGVDGSIRRALGRPVWDLGHPLGPPHTLQADPGGIYGVRVGFGDVWGHPILYRMVLKVFMGSGLGLRSFGVDGSIRRTLGRSVWDLGHPLGRVGPPHTLQADPDDIYGVRVGFGDIWVIPFSIGLSWWYLWGQGWVWGHLGHPRPYGVILGVFMGSGLGLGTPGVIPCPMGLSWGCLWGQDCLLGHLGSSHALWDGPGGVYGVRVGFEVFWGRWKHQKNFRKVCMGSWPSFGTRGATPHPPGRP
ncbi:uncharacterized protein LOC124418298 [Gallus gallus]|uniref:uncharacterized protein LOC124418298 n=1 Tax=Gallus gallus TaxID=9031 RepID=UPI001F017C82|nr:uncharacterized protein LOC124418298 [Gallus gallus]XP_046793569.1 uncharacterized protein LOC124418298 [Gallus gallus]XP_046793570.1 uncharacterized protein LOC124418298 [Gallus gallus]XP_046793571.1 uncharacterized protein LOC124418298 [Gallus gallus]